MNPRAARLAPQRKERGGAPTEKPAAQFFSVPAPVRGWVLDQNIAQSGGPTARVLDNFFSSRTGISVRGGSTRHATLPAAVGSLFTYTSGSAQKLFAATQTALYDVTSPANPLVAPAAAVSGRTSGAYSAAQFGTAGGNFLYAVNGADDALLFDGATWSTVNAVTTRAITGVATNTFRHVWSFANRLFFVEKNSMNAWYLPVDSIAGAAGQFSLAGVFTKGGTLLFGAKWSVDAGDGLDDKCVFVSSEGEVAVFEGTNPGNAATWSRVGTYSIAKPLGAGAAVQAGGDLLIATETGLVALSEAVQKDGAALAAGAVSAPIGSYWRRRVAEVTSRAWQIIRLPARNVMLVIEPESAAATGEILAVNLETGGWSRLTGWDAQCAALFLGRGMFGSRAGAISVMDNGGSDEGAVYTCALLGQFTDAGVPGRQKAIRQMRAVFQSATAIAPLVTARADYDEMLSPPPSSPADDPGGAWETGLWDVTAWDAQSSVKAVAEWVGVGVSGRVIAPELQLTFGVSQAPVVELAAIDMTFHLGAEVT